jgi:hypothetical protein
MNKKNKIGFGLIFICLLLYNCVPKHITFIEYPYPPDSITQWKNESQIQYDFNKAFSDLNPQYFTDSIRRKNKFKGTYRIAVLGDSWIWGDGIAYTKVWSHLLEQTLSKKYNNIELMSWGLCGWATLDEYNYFMQDGKDYDIDLLLIGFVENDLFMGRTEQPADDQDWLKNLYTESNRNEYLRLLNKIAALQNQFNVKIIFVIAPLCVNPERIVMKTQIIGLLEQANIEYVDLYLIYSSQFKNIPCGALNVNPINGHPGERLNEFISEQVFKYLKKHKYLKSLKRK